MATTSKTPTPKSADAAGGPESAAPSAASVPVVKTAVSGLLMGIANLIPGVSGGTMILAMGLYTAFIDSVADVTALRITRRSLVFLGVLGAFTLLSIKVLAGVILYLLFHHSAVMYALFIGMTLGGAPLLWRSIGRAGPAVGVAFAISFTLMLGLKSAQHTQAPAGGSEHTEPRSATLATMAKDVGVGTVAATTMVLPGISGSLVLLLLGQYERVVAAVDALSPQALEPLRVLVPVGVGAVLGVVALSNALKLLLHRFQRVTLAVLLGLLVGSVMLLWPFGRAPSEKAMRGRSVAELVHFAERHGVPMDSVGAHEAAVSRLLAQWDQRTVSDYAPVTVLSATAAAVGGFMVTFMLSRRGQSLGSGASRT